jgi:hypothetical protein
VNVNDRSWQAAALEGAYADFERCVDSRFGPIESTDLIIHYAALFREHQLAAVRRVDDAPEWTLADLMSRVDRIPRAPAGRGLSGPGTCRWT